MATPCEFIAPQVSDEPIEFMQDLFEPQFIDLMDDDEEHLVVFFRLAPRFLQLKKLVDLEVLAIGRHTAIVTFVSAASAVRMRRLCGARPEVSATGRAYSGEMEDESSHAATVLTASMSQFGKNAINYATSTVHAKGASLGRIVEMLAPQSDWHALDIATAAGHTAFAVAEHVASGGTSPRRAPAAEEAPAPGSVDGEPVDEVDPDAGLGLPEAGVVLGPPNLGGFESGEIITGTVLTVAKREAEVDLGDGKIGVVGDRHWSSEKQVDLTTVLAVGDTVEAAVLARADLKKRITLSRLWAQQKRGWEAAEGAAKDKGDLQATVTETVKGGLSLDVNGVRAFMPASLVDVHTVNDLKPLIGQTFAVRVIEADRTKARLIVSRKAAMRASQRQQAKTALSGIKVGQTMTGKVAQITDFGAFVDVADVRGLVHKSEIGWSRARDPQRELKVGQEVEVKVLKVQPSRNRLGLTMRTENDPLRSIRKGERFEATVTRLADFGAFVALPSGVEGLVHVSEMAEYRVFAPEEIVMPSEKVWVKVLKVDKKRRTVDLSMSQAVAPDPAEEIAANEAAAAAAEARAEEAAKRSRSSRRSRRSRSTRRGY